MFKPTGAIFGIDKPLPSNEGNRNHKVVNNASNKERLEQTVEVSSSGEEEQGNKEIQPKKEQEVVNQDCVFTKQVKAFSTAKEVISQGIRQTLKNLQNHLMILL